MKKPIILRFKPAQDGSFAAEKEKPCHLKLVVSNPDPLSKPPKPRNRKEGFSVKIHKKGHPHYTLVARAPFHYLECQINLEIHDNENDHEWEPGTVSCYFPTFETEDLDEFIEGNETLHGTILVLFQINILKRILFFARKHNALLLLVDVEDAPEGHALEAYEYLAIRKNKVPTASGSKTQLLIPTHNGTFHGLARLIDSFAEEFRGMLWEGKGSNPAIWEYLKSNPSLKML